MSRILYYFLTRNIDMYYIFLHCPMRYVLNEYVFLENSEQLKARNQFCAVNCFYTKILHK